jgi:IS1 family transposase
MNVLSKDKQALLIAGLTEGNSFKSLYRLTGVHPDTIMRLSVRVGEGCARLLDERMKGLDCNLIEIDELWQFVGKKQKNTTTEDRAEGLGDTWTFLSFDPHSKIIPNYRVGARNWTNAVRFLEDLAPRLKNRVQLSSDAMSAYADAVEQVWGDGIDYAQIVKVYQTPAKEEARRYSPPQIVNVRTEVIQGQPIPALVSTSYVERMNCTMRQHCKRLARLTLAFSKKPENFRAAIALQIASYNFCKFHTSLGMTPAMAAGIEASPWKVKDLLDAVL